MTKHDLKELAAMGAELGAAKAEVERLREALRWYEEKVTECRKIGSLGDNARQALDLDGGFRARDAISQQPEPTDTYTAVEMATDAAQGFRDGQAAVEPAPAQDEREAFEQHPLFRGMDFTRAATHPAFYASPYVGGAFDGWLAGRATRPAQTEQQPVATVKYGGYTAGNQLVWERAAGLQLLPEGTALYAGAALPQLRAVAYLDIGSGGYIDLGSDLTNEQLGTLQGGRHMLGIIGTYGADGYVPATSIAQTEQQPVAWVEVKDRHEGPYEFHGIELLDSGKHNLYAAPIAQTAPQGKFRMGDLVKKSTGSEWVGRVVGWYSTEQTKEGYAVESSAHRNSVQIYPVTALEAVDD